MSKNLNGLFAVAIVQEEPLRLGIAQGNLDGDLERIFEGTPQELLDWPFFEKLPPSLKTNVQLMADGKDPQMVLRANQASATSLDNLDMAKINPDLAKQLAETLLPPDHPEHDLLDKVAKGECTVEEYMEKNKIDDDKSETPAVTMLDQFRKYVNETMSVALKKGFVTQEQVDELIDFLTPDGIKEEIEKTKVEPDSNISLDDIAPNTPRWRASDN